MIMFLYVAVPLIIIGGLALYVILMLLDALLP